MLRKCRVFLNLIQSGSFIFYLFFNLAISEAQEAIHPDTSQEKYSFNAKKTYYVEPGTYGTKRESDPPSYIRNFGHSGFKNSQNLSWLDAGLDYRMRIEFRNNDIRRPESFNRDLPVLLRTRAYFGVKEKLDPFRFAVELEDARRYNGKYALDTRDANYFELIQTYGELHFKQLLGKDPLGNERPLKLRGGIMAFEFLDRRLIALNRWRNTTNTFVGGRVSLGQEKNEWQVELVAVRPMKREIERFDRPDNNQFFSLAMMHWRKWSKIITIEPYYIGLLQNASENNNYSQRNIHGLGLRLYGWVNQSGVNYDLTGMFQFGEDRELPHRAYSVTTEVGYSMKQIRWEPRISLFCGYASGDRNPNDAISNRFEIFFGFARPWSFDDYVKMENIIAPKIRIDVEPVRGIKIDAGYSFYWLASEKDRFVSLLAGSALNTDQTGESGKFLGHGMDFRIRFKPMPFIDANFGYSHFATGEFVKARQKAANGESAKSSDFLYLELSLNFFDILSFINKKTI